MRHAYDQKIIETLLEHGQLRLISEDEAESLLCADTNLDLILDATAHSDVL